MKIVSAEFIKSAFSLKDCPAGKLPEIALAGRSNVGKSSFLNRMVNRKGLARTGGTPGRTRLINFFLINGAFRLVDLPGYGYARVPEKMRREWGVLIRDYLEKRENLAGVVLILDIRHMPSEMDIQLYSWLQREQVPVIPVATKADKLSKNQAGNQVRAIRKVLGLDAEKPLAVFSAKTGQGREEIWSLIEGVLGQNSELRTQNSE
ncbi:MAG: ribosome biogenesis GTP-binding protein YihA/YsxC [Peptococcaceae bacterium]|nr:ribosome biogenesis GTP-binding protein YihA/YsxC [Peptococcaceae bacterium]